MIDKSKNSQLQAKANPMLGRPKLVVVAAVIYGCWLLWLAYVAWINVSAGNQ